MDVQKVKVLVPELRMKVKRRDKIIEQLDAQVRHLAVGQVVNGVKGHSKNTLSRMAMKIINIGYKHGSRAD